MTDEVAIVIKAVSILSIVLAFGFSNVTAAQAQVSNWNIKTGFGDEITIKNGIFGNKTKVVKDRLGNKYESKKGILGNTETGVSLLGNSYSKKKGLFGTKETEVTSILGDSIKTKKGWFGRRSTTIDASGVSNLIGSAIQGAKKKASGVGLVPDVSSFGSQSSIPGSPVSVDSTIGGAPPLPVGLDAQPLAQPLDMN